MKTDILISGFGGQGIMSLGRILARAAMKEGKHTTYFPSYGAEMRGGTAHCFVKISDSEIASPFVEHPGIALIFNQPSLDKFKDKLEDNSLLVLNSDLIEAKTGVENKSIEKAGLALSQAALECGNIKTANIVALGALVSLRPEIVKDDTVIDVLKETFSGKALESNLKAFKRGKNEV